MAKLVSNVYGDALFELAVEADKLDAFLEEAKVVLQVIRENTGFSQIMNHPKISKEEKLEVIETVFKNKVSDELVGLIRMIVEKGHSKEIEEVLEYFIDKTFEQKKIGKAKVVTAFELSDKQKDDIEKRLLETTNYVSFVMEYDVDPEIIGGMVIRIRDRVVDSSIKSKINKLKSELSNIQLKVGECAP